MIRIILSLLLWSLLPSLTLGQSLQGFTESFSGEGDFPSSGAEIDGLDNPDWSITSTFGDGQFEATSSGLAFSVSAADTTPDGIRFGSLQRELIGSGSFLETIALRSLDTDHITEEESGKSINFSHKIHERASIGWQLFSTFQEDRWAVLPIGSTELYYLPVGAQDVDIATEYLADENLVNTYVDVDPFDAIDAVLIGSRLLDRTAESRQFTRLVMGASGFEQPTIEGIIHRWSLTPFSNVVGDFDGDATLGVNDLDVLYFTIREGNFDERMDLDGDGEVSFADSQFWVATLKNTFFGDANLDGEFASSDLVNVFSAGEYEDDVELNSTWETGDWNGDGDFTSSDLVFAFQDGGYERARAAAGVPEPAGLFALVLGYAWLSPRRRNKTTPFCIGHYGCTADVPVQSSGVA